MIVLHVLIVLFAQYRVYSADLWLPVGRPGLQPAYLYGCDHTWCFHERLKQLNKRLYNITFGGILREFDAMGRAARSRMMDYVITDHRSRFMVENEIKSSVEHKKNAIEDETRSAAMTEVKTMNSIVDKGIRRRRRPWKVTQIKPVNNLIKNDLLDLNKINNDGVRSYNIFKLVGCSNDEKTLKVTLNDYNANESSTQIKTSAKGQKAQLKYQNLLARISNVLTGNLNKTMTAQTVTSTLPSIIDPHPVRDNRMMNVTKFVSSPPGFGILEMFCAACAPNSFSSYCLKCHKGFYNQFKLPGTQKSVNFRKIVDSDYQKNRTFPFWYYLTAFLFLVVCLIVVESCIFCCREKNESGTQIILNAIKRKLKNVSDYCLIRDDMEGTTDPNKQQALKMCLTPPKQDNKLEHSITDHAVNFSVLHERIGQHFLTISELDNDKTNSV